jgi:hypothetical protein
MGLTMGQRKAVTRQVARRYRTDGRAETARILDKLCALTGWLTSDQRDQWGDSPGRHGLWVFRLD